MRATALALPLALAALFIAPGCARIVEDSSGVAISSEEAGPFPEDYENVIRRWAVRELSRFSVVDRVVAPRPNPGMWERKAIMGGPVYGWVTTAQISGRDRIGMATGDVTYQIVIHEGEVVESRYQP